jgi:hypothetical protein
MEVHAATATSLAIVGTSALLGTAAHARHGNVRLRPGLIFGAASMVAAQPGVWLNRLVAGRVLLVLFGGLMCCVGVRMLRRTGAPLAAPPGDSSGPIELSAWPRLLTLGAVVGLLTGFFGIGGGFLIVPALVLAGRFASHHAVGTSLLIITMTSASGFLGHLRFGTVAMDIVGVFTLGGAAGVLAGTGLAGRLPGRTLTRVFGGFVVLLGLYVTLRNIGPWG